MRVVVYLLLLPPIVAMLGARPLADRLPPRLATWLLTLTALVLAAASSLALALLAATAVAQIPPVAGLAHLSVDELAEGDPTKLPIATGAGVLLTAALAAGTRMLWRRARSLTQAARQAAGLPGAEELVVLDDPAPDAFAVPGRPGRIVVSTGMLAALTADQQRVLLAHERTHLRCRHYLFTATVQLAATLNPLLRPVSTAVSYTVERWADEEAAVVCQDRRLAAEAVGAAALASGTHRGRADSAPGLAITGPWSGTAGPLPRRVAALLAVPRPRAALPVLVTLAMLVATGLCSLEATHDLHVLLALAHHGR